MSLRYEWTWDASLNPMSVAVTDDGGSFTVDIDADLFSHSNVLGDDAFEFSNALEVRLNSGSSSGTYTVIYSGTDGYAIFYSGLSLTLSFTGSDALEHMGAVLGMTDSSGSNAYSSTMRPQYLIIPAIQGRSKVTDEYEPDDITAEAVADDGTAYQISRETSEILYDWTQAAETQVAPSTFSDEGTPMHTRFATAEVPWTYQHAWRHMRSGTNHFYVIENGETTVHQMRAEGLSFHPMRFAADDYPLWSVDFKTRLLEYS